MKWIAPWPEGEIQPCLRQTPRLNLSYGVKITSNCISLVHPNQPLSTYPSVEPRLYNLLTRPALLPRLFHAIDQDLKRRPTVDLLNLALCQDFPDPRARVVTTPLSAGYNYSWLRLVTYRKATLPHCLPPGLLLSSQDAWMSALFENRSGSVSN